METKYKIHFTYIIGILIVIIIILLTIKWNGIPQLVELISFSLTLTSLILAILAIGYAVYTNNSSRDSLTKLNDASENISTTSNYLTDITSKLHKRIESIPSLLQSVEQKSDETQDLLKKILNKPEKPEYVEKITKGINMGIDVEGLIKGNSITGLVILLILKYAYEAQTQINFKELSKEFDLSNYSYIQGYLIPLSALNIYSYNEVKRGEDYDWLITEINEDIAINVEKELIRRDKELKEDDIDLEINKIVSLIKNYFN